MVVSRHRFLETRNSTDVFVYKTTSDKETIGDVYTGTAGFGKKFSMSGVATPGRQITCFMYNSRFVFWLCHGLMKCMCMRVMWMQMSINQSINPLA